MGRHSIAAYHDNGSLIWTGRLSRVNTPLLDLRGSGHRSNVRCQFRTVRAIVRALGEVPPLDTASPVVITRARPGPSAVAAVVVLATAVVTTLLA